MSSQKNINRGRGLSDSDHRRNPSVTLNRKRCYLYHPPLYAVTMIRTGPSKNLHTPFFIKIVVTPTF